MQKLVREKAKARELQNTLSASVEIKYNEQLGIWELKQDYAKLQKRALSAKPKKRRKPTINLKSIFDRLKEVEEGVEKVLEDSEEVHKVQEVLESAQDPRPDVDEVDNSS